MILDNLPDINNITAQDQDLFDRFFLFLGEDQIFNFINLQPGVYYLNATAMDNFGNMNSTQTLTITLQSSSLSPETPISYSASPYTYTDVYGPQYPQQQINNNAPSESSTGEVFAGAACVGTA